jgi:signal transduction histidine kinase
MIERVLTNLIDNAIRHTPAGGSVRVNLAPVEGRVQVTVSDTGPGIPPEQREGMFLRPFNQRGMSGAAGSHRGGGLGLLIVHRMLQLHDSQIRLVEREGRTPGDATGTAFRFALRAVSVQSATSRQAT